MKTEHSEKTEKSKKIREKIKQIENGKLGKNPEKNIKKIENRKIGKKWENSEIQKSGKNLEF